MTSSLRLSLGVALLLGGCAIDTTVIDGDAGALASDAAVVTPPDASTPPDAWAPDAWSSPPVTPPTGVGASATAVAGLRSSTDPCWIVMPAPGTLNAAGMDAHASCAVGTAEYRFSAQYVVTNMPASAWTAWQASSDACIQSPTAGYGVRFSIEVRCRAADGSESSAVTVQTCVMRDGSPC